MGAALSSSCYSRDAGNEGYPVILNVYDLTNLNNYMYRCGLGIFHSGIEVHGLEYGYGAHDFPTSGVFEVEAKSCPGFTYKCSILLGSTSISPTEFRRFVEHVAAEYHGDMYHLIYKNCNHFTEDVSLRLTGRCIPGWVNRLARIGSTCSCLLPESLQIPVVKQTAEYHIYSDFFQQYNQQVHNTPASIEFSIVADCHHVLNQQKMGQNLLPWSRFMSQPRAMIQIKKSISSPHPQEVK